MDALAIYAEGGTDTGTGKPELPVRPFEQLLEELKEVVLEVKNYLLNELHFDLANIVTTEGLYRIKGIKDAVEAINTNDETRKKFEIMAREVFKKHKAVMPEPIPSQLLSDRNAINKVYETLTDNETGADISAIMRRIQDVVDDSIKHLLAEPDQENGTIIDLSKLDFDLVRKMFGKSSSQKTEVQNLKQAIEEKLQQMIQQNPLRIDYYERYIEIIEEYNNGKDRATVENTFQELIKLVQSMSAEEQRVKREGLTEEQAAIFDLLVKQDLSSQERKKVKEVAIELLARLKIDALSGEHWSEKSSTAATVKNLINMYLYQHLPDPYSEKDIDVKSKVLFNHFKSSYFGGGASVYA